MSYKSSFTSGLWKANCDQCGRTFKSNELRLRWDNLMVCRGDWEPRQPQDYVRGVADIQAPPWARPEGPAVFVSFGPPPAPIYSFTLNGQELNSMPLNGPQVYVSILSLASDDGTIPLSADDGTTALLEG